MTDQDRQDRSGDDEPTELDPTEPSQTQAAPGSTSSGEQIGPYRLLHKLGEGGMGEVWMAEQRRRVKRKVALKLIKQGMDTQRVVARFEAERQALAVMNHPNVSKVFDAGSTPRGRPYFVMEYVEGVPITEHCDRQRLTTRERLDLFVQVCAGVQHAHQNAIIHRDIKPSNVLVTTRDGEPVPKIIDFGVAKATAQRLTERTAFTELGQLIGTPAYMSPEQAEMNPENVDTRTDVYSLGMLLYELLVGALPFDPKDLRQAGFDEIRRKIREDEPSRPSARVSTLGDASTAVAERRRSDPVTLVKLLRGDLDWITMKALEKDRTRRYASPSELSADIKRYFRHEPVIAGPPGNVYRLRKFVRRRRIGVAAGSVVVLASLSGVTGVTLGLMRAMRAERVAKAEARRANYEAQTAQEVKEFLLSLLLEGDPSRGKAAVKTVDEVLDRGTQKVLSGLESRPLLRAEIMETLGRVYLALASYEQSTRLLESSLEIRRSVLGDHVDVAQSLDAVGFVYFRQGEYDKAEPVLNESLRIRTEVEGADSLGSAEALSVLADIHQARGALGEAEMVYRQILKTLEANVGESDFRVGGVSNKLARLYLEQGKYPEAESLCRRSIRIKEQVNGPDHPSVASSLATLAEVYRSQGKYVDAEALYRRALDIRKQAFGPDHPVMAATLERYITLLRAMNRNAEADELEAQAEYGRSGE